MGITLVNLLNSNRVNLNILRPGIYNSASLISLLRVSSPCGYTNTNDLYPCYTF